MMVKRLVKTQAGLDAFNARSRRFTPRQRPLFLMCDGQRGVDAVLADTAVVGTSRADVDYLVAQGFLAWAPEAETQEVSPLVAPSAPPALAQAEERTPHVEHWTLF